MTPAIKQDAYKLIKAEIDSRGLKNTFVAKEMGTSPSYLGQIINGKRRLTADFAIKASQVLNIPLSIFLNQD